MKKIIILAVLLFSITLFAGFNRYLPTNKWYLQTSSNSDLIYNLEFYDDYTFMLGYGNRSLKFAHRLYGKYTINKDDTVTLYSKPLIITYYFKLPYDSSARSEADLLSYLEQKFLKNRDLNAGFSKKPILIFKNMKLREKSFIFHADNLSKNVFLGK